MFWQCKYATSSRIDEILEDYKSNINNASAQDGNETVEENSENKENALSETEKYSTAKSVDSAAADNTELEASILTELLSEDELLQEVRTRNQQLLDFLCKRSVFDFMISQIVTIPPEENVEMSERFKKPSVISEILSSCTDQICECLIEEERLDKLWTLLSQNVDDINPLQASFFAKVVTSLFPTYASQFCLYLTTRNHIMSSLVTHIGNSAFADVIMRIVTYQENETIRDDILKYMREQQLVSLLIESLGSARDNQAKMNSAMVLEDLIRLSRDHLITTVSKDETDLKQVKDSQCAFLRDILSQPSVDMLLSQLTNHPNDITTVGFTIKLFVSMITAKPMALSLAGANEEFSPNTLQIVNQTISLAFDMLTIKPVFENLVNVFRNPPYQHQVMLTSSDSPQTPFGWVRLEIVEFVGAVLEQFASNATFFIEACSETLRKLLESNIMSLLIDSFFVFTSNNVLHGLVVKLIKSYLFICSTFKTLPLEIANKLSPIDMGKVLFKDTSLMKHLVSSWQCELNRRMSREKEENNAGSGDSEHSSPSNVVKALSEGNFGHVVVMSEEVNKFFNDNNCLDVYLVGELEQQWKGPISDELTKILKDYERPLGGTNPNKYSTDDEDSTSVLLSFNEEPALQKAYVEYSMQEMTMDTSQFESLTGPRDLDEFFSGKSLPVGQFVEPIVPSMNDFSDHERATSVFESLNEQKIEIFKGLDEYDEDEEDDQMSGASRTINQTYEMKEGDKFKIDFFNNSAPSKNSTSNSSTFPSTFCSNANTSTNLDNDPFSSTDTLTTVDKFGEDLFSGSPFKTADFSSSPNDGTTGTATARADPFSSPVSSQNDSSNWADFTNFATAVPSENDEIVSCSPFSVASMSSKQTLVLQSYDEESSDSLNQKPPAALSSGEHPFPPPVFPTDLDNDEELEDNFAFLTSSGLTAKSASSSSNKSGNDH